MPVSGDTADVRLSLGYDEKGQFVLGGTCTVDGVAVTVDGEGQPDRRSGRHPSGQEFEVLGNWVESLRRGSGRGGSRG